MSGRQDSPQDSPIDFRYRIQKSAKTDIIGKTTRLGGLFHERPMAAEYCATCESRFFYLFWLIPVVDRNQKEISPSADGDSGLCPEDPQAFRERLERKLHFAHGAGFPYFAAASVAGAASVVASAAVSVVAVVSAGATSVAGTVSVVSSFASNSAITDGTNASVVLFFAI